MNIYVNKRRVNKYPSFFRLILMSLVFYALSTWMTHLKHILCDPNENSEYIEPTFIIIISFVGAVTK